MFDLGVGVRMVGVGLFEENLVRGGHGRVAEGEVED